ncbi:MAG TPA: histidine kinase [Thermoanaerobaculales bacterium]|nr:histidine kinase [Thermoanaerobaculales bacterium]
MAIEDAINSDARSTPPVHSGDVAGAPGEWRQNRWSSPFMKAVFLFALWTLPGILYTAQIYEIGVRETPPATLLAAAVHALPTWWIWVPATPLVIWLARRLPIRRGRALWTVLFHLLSSFAVAMLLLVVVAYWYAITGPFDDRIRTTAEWIWTLRNSTHFHLFILSYWLILSAAHIVESEQRLRRQQLNTARIDALAAQSRTQMLANQLKPHFLFNALNGLSTLILRGDNASAQLMLESLASFLRESLRIGESRLVPLRDEFELTSKYLSVEKVRLGDKLQLRTEIDPDTENALVPTLLLQPLVENAIRHGIGSTESGGEVVIRSDRIGTTIRLQVENDGTGLAAGWQKRAEESVGLANTRRRLALMTDGRYEMRLDELEGGRVRVELVIPFQRVQSSTEARGGHDEP